MTEIPRTTRKQLGFLVQDLHASQLGYYLVKNLNELCVERPDIEPIVFFDRVAPYCKTPQFACMNMAEAWGYNGIVIATSALLANILVNMPCPRVKYLYAWDLDWLRGQNRPYALFNKLFHEPSLKLIARSQNHIDIIRNDFNIKVKDIMDDFNWRQLLPILGI